MNIASIQDKMLFCNAVRIAKQDNGNCSLCPLYKRADICITIMPCEHLDECGNWYVGDIIDFFDSIND